MGSRVQPLAFSKALLPVGSRTDGGGVPRPRAVGEYLVERMIAAGATKICFVIPHRKSDIIEYFGGRIGATDLCYVVQPDAGGLCDAIFRALPVVEDEEEIVVGLPDTVWFPESGLCALPKGALSFLLFPVETPELFDAVVLDEHDRIVEFQVKTNEPSTRWVWGAFKLDGWTLRRLFELWNERQRSDAYVGTLVNAFLAKGHEAYGIRAGDAYVDVGTLDGYRKAIHLLANREAVSTEEEAAK
jgi:dTDP-glucose pyrophosphorylase